MKNIRLRKTDLKGIFSRNLLNKKQEAFGLEKFIQEQIRDIDRVAEYYIKKTNFGSGVIHVCSKCNGTGKISNQKFQYNRILTIAALEDELDTTLPFVDTNCTCELGELNWSIEHSEKTDIIKLNREIRMLKQRHKQKPKHDLRIRIKKLSAQLRSKLDVNFDLSVRRLQRLVKEIFILIMIDRRLRIRSIISIIYKCFSDFSDCENDLSVSGAGFRHSFNHSYFHSHEKQDRINRRTGRSYCIGSACASKGIYRHAA